MTDNHSSSIRIVVVQRFFAHYRQPLFDSLLKDHSEFQLTVFCQSSEIPRPEEGISVIKTLPDYVHNVKIRRLKFLNNTLYYHSGLLRALRKSKYDIVIVEGALSILSSTVALLWSCLTNKKRIIWLKGWFDQSTATRNGLKKLIRRCFLLLADQYLAYGSETQKQLTGEFGISPSRITVIHNTVDVYSLIQDNPTLPIIDDPEINEIIKDRVVLFSAGRLTTEKRFDDLIQAFGQIESSHPDCCLLIAGHGPKLTELKDLCIEKKCNKVLFLGNVSDSMMNSLFKLSTICVFAGAVGLSLNQAMAAGKPVVCADEPGPDTELLIHFKNGLRFPVGDIESMASALISLIDNPKLAHPLGNAARETILTKATMDHMSNAVARAILNLAGRKVSIL